MRNFINGKVPGRAMAVIHTLAGLRMLCTDLSKVKSLFNDIRIVHCSGSYLSSLGANAFPLKFSRVKLSTCRYGLVKIINQVILCHNTVYIWNETKMFFSNTLEVVKQYVGDQLVD